MFPIQIEFIMSDLEFENVQYEIYFSDLKLIDHLEQAELEILGIIALEGPQIQN